MPAGWDWKGSCRSGSDRAIVRGARRTGSRFKNPGAPAVKREAEEDWARSSEMRKLSLRPDGATGQVVVGAAQATAHWDMLWLCRRASLREADPGSQLAVRREAS
jgi:hypothetical protein